MNMKRLSGFLLILVLLFSCVACTTDSTATRPPETVDESSLAENEENTETLQKEADVVVVGGGITGLSAALEAAENGAKVILLEKAAILGGNGNYSEGIFAVGSALQQELGMDIEIDYILKTEYEFQNYRVNPKLWEMVTGHSAENVQWLLDMGVTFDTVTNPAGGDKTEKTWHVYAATEYEHGAAVVHIMQQKAEKLGVEILLSTPANELIMEGERISGVNATTEDGGELTINTKAVILATGGFGANSEMVAELTRNDTSQITYRGVPTNTGDGIRMARAVGAYPDNNIVLCMLGLAMDGKSVYSEMSEAAAFEPTNIWVNQDAQRYVPEDLIHYETRAASALQLQCKTFSIMDSASIKRLVEEGCVNGYGLFVPTGQKLSGLEDEIVEALSSNDPDVFVADTLEELAEKMGVDKDSLIATIDEYNTYCDEGEDLQYGKDPSYLNEIRTGPFYGFRIVSNALNTMGGIRVNTNCEVLNEQFEPIKGLYAAGMELSGFSGETYGLVLPGSTQSICVTTGRVSGSNSVAYANSISE